MQTAKGNWHLHITCIRHIIPWCFATDKTNYARYLPVYCLQMSKLDEISPELHRHFMNGGFSVQMGEANKFGRVAVDQTLEETINRDTQTAGGTKGFSLKQGQFLGIISQQSTEQRHCDNSVKFCQ